MYEVCRGGKGGRVYVGRKEGGKEGRAGAIAQPAFGEYGYRLDG